MRITAIKMICCSSYKSQAFIKRSQFRRKNSPIQVSRSIKFFYGLLLCCILSSLISCSTSTSVANQRIYSRQSDAVTSQISAVGFSPRSDCINMLGPNATKAEENKCVDSYFADKDSYLRDKISQGSNLATANSQKNSGSMDIFKSKCKDLGFLPKTEGFGKCVLQLSK